jgi:hypothetical protein
MDAKIKSITFRDTRHRIAAVHFGATLIASDNVSMRLHGPFVECVFEKDPGNLHLVPISGISDICVEAACEPDTRQGKKQ